MGKYMRKAKLSGEVAVMEVPHQSSLGVRTRARTLALQRLLKPTTDLHQPSPATTKTTSEVNSGTVSTDHPCSYIQLRSRRLEKTPLAVLSPRASTKDRDASGIGRNSGPAAGLAEANDDTGVDDVSFGENVLDVETRDRNSRETTPCSLILNTESIRTPGSTTRRPYSNELPIGSSSRRGASSADPDESRNIPTSREMEEFFSGAEQFQRRIFIEKYNFDPVNDRPLPGRYEWLELKLGM